MNDDDLNKVLRIAFEFFNDNLFDNELPECVITLQRKRGARGYFWAEQWVREDTKEVTHEIAINPEAFADRSTKDILSTLVHEMVHMQQQCFGKPGARGYHNLEWVELMQRVGLTARSVDNPEKQVGTRVTHDVDEGGVFDLACNRLLDTGLHINWRPVPIEPQSAEARLAKSRRASKTKFTCPECGLNAWAKQDASLGCWTCGVEMEDNDHA